jgi:hypothetical protein
MIPTLGLLIGAYCTVKMIDLIADKGKRGVVKAFASVAIVVIVICVLSLLSTGMTTGLTK